MSENETAKDLLPNQNQPAAPSRQSLDQNQALSTEKRRSEDNTFAYLTVREYCTPTTI
jgi:hypothetical protein